jgi:twitching motility protein PilT
MARIDALLEIVHKHGASDLHIRPGCPPMIRVHGEISALTGQEVSAELITLMLDEIMEPDVRSRLNKDHDVDFAYEVPGKLRVRCNVFHLHLGVAAAFRVLPSRIFTVDELRLPVQLRQLTELKRGLVIVTGPPGSGKSTTLAALLDHINRNQRKHILTIEDPIEYRHTNAQSMITHREVGRHSPSFERALRAALREDPDVIMVGEMRDAETMALALTAAATGQLVFATLHTPSAAQSVDRVLDSFDSERQAQVRMMLAESLRCVIAQRLLRRADILGRVLALEVLVGTYAVAAMIRERKTFQLPSVMQTGRKEGMQTLDDAILKLVRDGVVSDEEAQVYLQARDPLGAAVRQAASQASTTSHDEAA